jgi:AcrR family transcriptional regulator
MKEEHRAMPRPSTAARQPAQSRDKLLEAAFEVFARYGYAGATTREICARAGGLNVSALHYHWGDKAQLWDAVCERYSRRIRDIVAASADLGAPPDQAVPAFLGAVFDAFVAHPDLARFNMWVTLEADTIDYQATRRHMDPLVHMGAAYLKQQQAQGMMKDVDVEAVLVLVSAQLIYALAQRNAHRHLFKKDLSDARHASRIKRSFMKSAMHLMGMETAEQAEINK